MNNQTEQAQQEFQELVAPVIKWMAENVHPHHTLIVDATRAELLEGQRVFSTHEYLKD